MYDINEVFSSPCLGILFSLGRPISTTMIEQGFSFRPHVWGFFFHTPVTDEEVEQAVSEFSSPCLGVLFSQDNYRIFRKYRDGEFSSPCLGILFSQQAWGAPRGGLSMALLRRGFPIAWNSHDFHPLTFCFLRFHAHRRGFSK